MRIDLVAPRSSPGVTTTALALATVTPARVLVVEASEDGGVLAARYGLSSEPGLTTLAAARQEPTASLLRSHAQALPGTDGRIQALVGPGSAEAAHVLMRSGVDRLAACLQALDDGTTVLVDHGRLPAQPATLPLLAASDHVAVVVRPTGEQLHALARRLPVFSDLGPPVSVLPIGRSPYGPEEIAATLGCRVTGAIADDPASAAAMAGQRTTRRLDRGPLLRSMVPIADRLLAAAGRRPQSRDRRDAVGLASSRPFTAVQP